VARSLALAAMFVLAMTSLFATLHAPSEMSREFLTFAVVLGFAPLVVQGMYKLLNRRKTNWLCVELLTMFFYAIVHFGCIIYWLNGENPYEIVMWHSVKAGDASGRVCFTIAMCATGLAMFGVGYNLLPDRYETAVFRSDNEVSQLSLWRFTGFLICLIAAVMALTILLLLGPSAFEGGYRGTEGSSGLVNILVRGNSIITLAGAACLSVASFRKTGRFFTIGLIPSLLLLAVVCGYAIHGDRNLPFNCIAACAVAFGEYVRRISLWQCVAFMVIAIIGGTLVGVARVSPQRTLSSMYHTVIVNSDKIRADSAFVELAYQAQPLFASTAWVPEKHPYYNGSLLYLEAIGGVPFIMRFPLTQRIFHGREYYETNSATLLTWVVLGNFLSGGKGTTSVADFYLNFGVFGVLAGMAFQGVFAKYIQQRARQSDGVIWGSLHACLLPAWAYSARAVFHTANATIANLRRGG